VQARATYYDVESDLTLQVFYYQLLKTQKDFALEVNPFYGELLELFPYYQTRFLASKTFLEWIYLEGGFDFRRVDDEDDVGQFNRDFERYYGIATFQDVLQEGLDFSVTGDVYDSDDSDVEAWGANVNKRFDERWEGAIGTYYSLFKYDYLSQKEKDDVRTYYARIEYRFSASWRFHAWYEYEDDDYDNYSTLRVGALWSF